MRISKLSACAGLPVGTVKFYLRTGLLHPGQATSATQALYDGSHLARLKAVRALLEVGGLSLAEIRQVLDAVDLHGDDPDRGVAKVQDALSRTAPSPTEPDLAAARGLIESLGWTVAADSPHLPLLARALSSLDSVGVPAPVERLKAYADAAGRAAREDQRLLSQTSGAEQALTVATSSVLFDAVLVALRRLAGEHLVGAGESQLSMHAAH